MLKRTRTILVAATAAAALLSAVPIASGAASGPRSEDVSFGEIDDHNTLRAFGITRDQRLVRFETDARDDIRVVGKIAGLEVDQRVVGIDFRPATGQLYGLGDAGGIYTIATRSAHATRVSQLNVPLEGTFFGVDFNPAVDRLRIISDTGQNLRHDVTLPTGGTIMDGTLTYPATTTTPATTATGVTGAAYTNNDTSADTSATLYDIDTNLDQVVIQSPANAGLLAATGKLTVDAGTNAGFDIYSKVREGTAVALFPYAVLRVDGRFGLYDVRLANGVVEREYQFPRCKQVTDIAIPLNQL